MTATPTPTPAPAAARVYTVRIVRQYRSANPPHELRDALTPAGWAALLARIAELRPVAVADFTDQHGAGVTVTVTAMRGPGGAYGMHDLASRYGALPVIE